jgi:hypothetical protein
MKESVSKEDVSNFIHWAMMGMDASYDNDSRYYNINDERRKLVSRDPLSCLAILLTMVMELPEQWDTPDWGDHYEYELSETLALCAWMRPEEFLSGIQPLMGDKTARRILLVAVGCTYRVEGLDFLRQKVDEIEDLSEDELSSLLGSIENIGSRNPGSDAKALLNCIETWLDQCPVVSDEVRGDLRSAYSMIKE